MGDSVNGVSAACRASLAVYWVPVTLVREIASAGSVALGPAAASAPGRARYGTSSSVPGVLERASESGESQLSLLHIPDPTIEAKNSKPFFFSKKLLLYRLTTLLLLHSPSSS